MSDVDPPAGSRSPRSRCPSCCSRSPRGSTAGCPTTASSTSASSTTSRAATVRCSTSANGSRPRRARSGSPCSRSADIVLPLRLEWIAVLTGIALTLFGLTMLGVGRRGPPPAVGDRGARPGRHRRAHRDRAHVEVRVERARERPHPRVDRRGAVRAGAVGAPPTTRCRGGAPWSSASDRSYDRSSRCSPSARSGSWSSPTGARLAIRTSPASRVALAVPVVYEIFRMGYYAALVPNSALAKEASRPVLVGRLDLPAPHGRPVLAVDPARGPRARGLRPARRCGPDARPSGDAAVPRRRARRRALHRPGRRRLHAGPAAAPRPGAPLRAGCRRPVPAGDRRRAARGPVGPRRRGVAPRRRRRTSGLRPRHHQRGHPRRLRLATRRSGPRVVRPVTASTSSPSRSPARRRPTTPRSRRTASASRATPSATRTSSTCSGLGDAFTSHLRLDHRGTVAHEKPLPFPWIVARTLRPGSRPSPPPTSRCRRSSSPSCSTVPAVSRSTRACR